LINKPPQERALLDAVREALSVHNKGTAVKQATPQDIDALKELINIGVGRAAAALNEMVKFRVRLEVPFVRVLSPLQFKEEMKDLGDAKMAAVRIGFDGPFSGTAALVIPPDSAVKLVNVLTGEAAGAPDLDPAATETLREVGNIVINGVMGSLGNILKQRLSYSLPAYVENTVKQIFFSEKIGNDTIFLLVRTRFTIQKLEIEGNIILLFTVGAFDALLSAIEAMQ
jgi:chemotaxis protein CheC